jgi:hypothetical protein
MAMLLLTRRAHPGNFLPAWTVSAAGQDEAPSGYDHA